MTTRQDVDGTEPADEVLLELAGWWRRVAAFVIDGILIGVLLAILALLTDGYHLDYQHGGRLIAHTSTAFAVGSIAIGVIYQLLTLCRPGAHNGQTFGDQLLGITVTRDDGQPFDLTTFLVRQALLQLLPSYAIQAIPHFGGLSLLWAAVDDFWPLWDRESRALHDFAAKTHVLRTRPTR